MPGTHENDPGESRLDRMERLMAELAEGHAWFDEEYKRLLAAQAALDENLNRIAEANRKRRQEPS